MRTKDPVVGLLAEMVNDTCWGNRWHRLASATEELTEESLDYQPVPRVHSPRRILRHAVDCARWYADGLAPRTDDPCEGEWDRLRRRRSTSAACLVEVMDAACRRLHARSLRLTDAALLERCGVWREAYKGYVLLDGGILHAAWHFGQVAMLSRWQRAGRETPLRAPLGPPGKEGRAPRRDWATLAIGTRKAVCLRLLDAAFCESPWHALRRRVQGLSEGELTWSPFEGTWGPMIARHVAHCKVIYADQAFGSAALSWADCDRLLGAMNGPDGDQLLRILDRAQEYLVEHVSHATEEQMERTYPMHHGVPHTGWQVACAMAQHDAWHGGQIALMRETYRALAAAAG